MKKSKHTKGPWLSYEECPIANARLLAAAPDLLAALLTVSATLESHVKNGVPLAVWDAQTELNEINAALAELRSNG